MMQRQRNVYEHRGTHEIYGVVRVFSTALFSACPPGVGCTSSELLLPIRRIFAILPCARDGIKVEVAIAVAISFLEQLEQGVPERRVHAHGLARVVAANVVARQALLEERLFERAAAVKHA